MRMTTLELLQVRTQTLTGPRCFRGSGVLCSNADVGERVSHRNGAAVGIKIAAHLALAL